jgi:hypothetical protein
MKWFRDNHLIADEVKRKIIDVGSLCAEGGIRDTYRQLFDDGRFEYTGLDMIEGPNVDVAVRQPYKWSEIADGSFDAAIIRSGVRTCGVPVADHRRDGPYCPSRRPDLRHCPNGLGRHRYPVDCWRYYSDGMVALARYAGLEVVHVSTDEAPYGAPVGWYGHWRDCMLVARKPSEPSGPIDPAAYHCIPARLDELNSGFVTLNKQPLRTRLKTDKALRLLKNALLHKR